MRKPRICIFTETYYPVVGGTETQASALAEGLVASGFDVFVLTRRSDASFPAVESFGEITVRRLPPVGRGHLKKWGLLLSGLLALVRLRRQYDLVFVSGFRAVGPAAVLAGGLFGKGCILKSDSLGEMSGRYFVVGLAKLPIRPPDFLFKAALRLRNAILRRANAFVAISSEVESELMAHGVDPRRIHRIPNSVDTERFRPVDLRQKEELRRRLGILSKETIVIYTGRLVSYKGLPLLLRVWKGIQSRYPDVGLVLVGSGGLDLRNCEAELRAYVKENGLDGSVQFTGAVHNVQQYLQASDIFAFPTESEAFGISLIEAMACGLPSIATPVGGVKDILAHGHDGLVVPTGDSQELGEGLGRLISDSSLASRLGASARETVLERYSAEEVARKYLALFDDVLKQSGPQSLAKDPAVRIDTR